MKEHFKLYKAGKLWLTACIVALGVFGASSVYADDQQPTQNVQTTVTTQSNLASTTNNDQANNGTNTSKSEPNNGNLMPSEINGYTAHTSNGTTTWQNASGQLANGWQNNQNDWYYFNNGQSQNNWQQVDNNWYYMNPTTNIMETGLQTINNNKYFLNDQHDGTYGAMKTGWQYTNNAWYHFQQNGAADTGWQWLDNNWYYMNPATAQMEAGIQKIGNSTYYLNDQVDGTYGAMKTGWQNVNNHWYYFNPNGDAWTGWYRSSYGNWYYFDQNGQAASDWQTVNNRTYYFDPTNAWALTGWQLLGDNWYYFDPTNVWVENGWQYIGDQWYYMDPTTNQMQVGLQTINGQLYYLQSNGAMATGWQNIDGNWYYFNQSGAALTGWQSINGSEYYLDPATHQMLTGIQAINGDYYFFAPSGAQQKGMVFNPTTGLLQYYDQNTGVRQNSVTLAGKTYLFNATTGDINTDDLTDGLVKIGNNHYYFIKSNNRFTNDAWEQVNGSWYYFGDDASATTGWYKSPAGYWYYFNQDGATLTKWQRINGRWYLFDDTNANAITGWYKSAAGFWYYFDPENAWADTGWTFVGHDWYYMDPTDAYMYTGGHWINGHWVNFQSNGAFVGFNQRVINWFLDRRGRLTYSMYGSRTGADGTADCSGSMTQAVWSAGGSRPTHIYSTLDLGSYLLRNGYYLAGRGRGVQDVQYGDIVIWGNPGNSAGGAGHTVVISTAGPDPMCISTCGYYWSDDPNSHYGAAGQAVQEFNYQWYWNDDDRPYQMVYRPNFYWA